MTVPKFNLPVTKVEKSSKMSFKDLVGKKMTKSVKFMGEDVKISKLSVSEVMDIQEKAKSIASDENEGFTVLKVVIKASVEGAGDLADEDFNTFPMDELAKLSNEIMKFSGIGQDSAAGKSS